MRSERSTTVLTWLLLFAFGVSFGLNYGVANHVFYLLPSLRALHPELWVNDWVVTKTHHYHAAFGTLAVWMLELDPSGWIFAFANVAAIAGGLGAVWALLKSLVPPESAKLSLLILLAIATGTRTNTAGTSYIFSTVFQPNTLGSVGVLVASWLLVSERPLASGIALAVSGLFHANYLVLCGPVFCVAQLAQGRAGLVGRWLRQLGPPLLVLPLFLPMILATGSAPVVAEAQRIYQEIRSPHHYRIANFARELLPWFGWQLLGVSAGWAVFRERPAFRKLLGLLLGFWTLIVPSLLLCAVFVLRPLIQLYPWRLAPNCELLAQAVFAAAMVQRLLSPTEQTRAGRAELALSLLSLGLIAYGGVVTRQLLPFVIGASTFLLAQLSWLFRASVRAANLRQGLLPVLVLVLVLANAGRFSRLPETSSLLGANRGVRQLCAWLDKNTPLDAVLLTPPNDEDIRFTCQRATIVDWKTAPMVPKQVIEWLERVEDVTGLKPLRGEADLAAYASLHAARLQYLRHKYGFDYVVATRGHELQIGVEPAFRGEQFVAYRLPPADEMH